MAALKRRAKPASKRHVVPCPQCGAKWPIVQALWEPVGKRDNKLICCCTTCGIEGEIKVVIPTDE